MTTAAAWRVHCFIYFLRVSRDGMCDRLMAGETAWGGFKTFVVA